MTRRPSPYCFWMRRALDRISGIVMFGESSMVMGAPCTLVMTRVMASHSGSLMPPPRMWWMATLASAESRRMAISAPVISSEKIADGTPCLTDAARQKSSPSVDLPTPGRAATTIIWPGRKPVVRRSSSGKPDPRPAISPSRLWMSSISWMVGPTSSAMVL